MRPLKLLTISLVLPFILATSCAAAEELKLSEKLITAWMNSQGALAAWGEKHQAQLEANEPSTSTPESPTDMSTENMIAPLKAAGLYGSANQLVQTLGFSNIDEWAAVTLRITQAAAAIEFESNPGMMDNSQLEALRNSTKISPEHKQMLNKAIEQNQAMVKQILGKSSKADKEAIKPYLERILKMMEESD